MDLYSIFIPGAGGHLYRREPPFRNRRLMAARFVDPTLLHYHKWFISAFGELCFIRVWDVRMLSVSSIEKSRVHSYFMIVDGVEFRRLWKLRYNESFCIFFFFWKGAYLVSDVI